MRETKNNIVSYIVVSNCCKLGIHDVKNDKLMMYTYIIIYYIRYIPRTICYTTNKLLRYN